MVSCSAQFCVVHKPHSQQLRLCFNFSIISNIGYNTFFKNTIYTLDNFVLADQAVADNIQTNSYTAHRQL